MYLFAVKHSPLGCLLLLTLSACGSSSSQGEPAADQPLDGAQAAGPTAQDLDVAENVGSVVVPLRLAAPAVEAGEATVEVGGSAVLGQDFALLSSVVALEPGLEQVQIEVQILDDALDEEIERFTLAVGESSVAVTIADDDDPPQAQFAISEQTAAETDGRVLLRVDLSSPSGRNIEVPFLIQGGDTESQDFFVDGGPLRIAAGLTSTTFDLGIVYDGLLEDSEELEIALGEPVNATVGERSVHTIRILDVEPAPRVSFAVSAFDAIESAGGFDLPVVVEPTGVLAPDTVGDGSERLPYPAVRLQFDLTVDGEEPSAFTFDPEIVLSNGETETTLSVSFEDDDEAESVVRVRADLAQVDGATTGAIVGTDVLVHDDDRGVRVVHVAKLAAGGNGIFRDDLIGTEGAALLASLADGVKFSDLSRSPDGTTLAFLADAELAGRFDLWALDLEEGILRLASDPLAAPLGVIDFRWSPDSERLAWRSEEDFGEPVRLFTVELSEVLEQELPLAATASIQVASPGGGQPFGPLFADGVVDYAFSPDGQTIAWQADSSMPGHHELLAAAVDGGVAIDVSGPMAPGTSMPIPDDSPSSFAWSPDGSLLAYRADQNSLGQVRLFVAQPDGSGRVVVSGSLGADGDVTEFEWSTSGALLSFRADAFDDERFELFTVTPDGAERTHLTEDLFDAEDGDDEDVLAGSSAWSPTADDLAWIIGGDEDTSPVVFVQREGGNPKKVSLPAEAGSDLNVAVWSPNGERIAFVGLQSEGGEPRLFLAEPTGFNTVGILNGLVPEEGVIDDIHWSPDSARVAFVTQMAGAGSLLYTVGASGGNPLLVAGPTMKNKGEVIGRWEEDSSRMIVSADLDVDKRVELYTVREDDVAGLAKISSDDVAGKGVDWFDVR